MKIAFILFDGMTTLDFAGFYDAVTELKGMFPDKNVSWEFCAMQEQVTDDRGLTLSASRVSPDLSGFDLLFVPGGFATRQLRFDASFTEWLQTARDIPIKASVCTGALLLGAAGFLEGRQATTNRSAYDLLVPYCGRLEKARIVRDGNVVTAGGVAASIDLGLYVVEWLTDAATAATVQQAMDYPYYRPGGVDKALALEVVTTFTEGA